MSTILELNKLHVSYGKVEALHGCSLKVEAGQIVTVIGPNGAGKSTMLNAIMGSLPSTGSADSELRKTGVATLLIEQNARAALLPTCRFSTA